MSTVENVADKEPENRTELIVQDIDHVNNNVTKCMPGSKRLPTNTPIRRRYIY